MAAREEIENELEEERRVTALLRQDKEHLEAELVLKEMERREESEGGVMVTMRNANQSSRRVEGVDVVVSQPYSFAPFSIQTMMPVSCCSRGLSPNYDVPLRPRQEVIGWFMHSVRRF